MSYEEITTEVVDGHFVLTLNRPERRNAFTQSMSLEILAALDDADADDSARAIILTGAPAGNAFCAGADLSQGGSTFAHSTSAHRDNGGRVAMRLMSCLKPVVAAINGPAVGVGASMILAADVRLAVDTARFGYVFARRGITVDGAASWFLPRAVGVSKALEWAMYGRVFPAEEAAEAGLVRSPLLTAETLMPEAHRLADQLTESSAPVSVAITRQLIWRVSGLPDPMTAHIIESRSIQARGTSADAQEGVTSFLERREPQFPLRVSTDLPDFFPWWDDQEFVPLSPSPRHRTSGRADS